MKDTYTPGPWTPQRWWESAELTLADADSDDRARWEADPIKCIVGPNEEPIVACHDLGTIAPANARLIAAAPELAELLRRAIVALDAPGIRYGDTDDEPWGIIRAARQLLARIDGDSRA